MRMIKTLLPIVAIGLISSCLTNSVESTIDPAHREALKKVFVVIDAGTWEYTRDQKSGRPILVAEYLAVNLEKRLLAQNVEAKVKWITGMELGADPVNKEIDQFGADRLMVIRLTGGVLNGDGLLATGVFIANLTDMEQKSTFWSAKVEVNNIVVLKAADRIIDKLFEAMKHDGLLTAVTAPTK